MRDVRSAEVLSFEQRIALPGTLPCSSLLLASIYPVLTCVPRETIAFSRSSQKSPDFFVFSASVRAAFPLASCHRGRILIWEWVSCRSCAACFGTHCSRTRHPDMVSPKIDRRARVFVQAIAASLLHRVHRRIWVDLHGFRNLERICRRQPSSSPTGKSL
jgi:hypothetical protein